MSRFRRPHCAQALPLLVAVTVAALSAADAGAQERSRSATPTDGDWSIMFTIFEETEVTNFGIFRMFGDRANVGLEVDLDWAEGEQKVMQNGNEVNVRATSWVAVFGPSLRWYGNRIGPVSPYLRTRLSVGWGGENLEVNGNEQNDDDLFILDGTIGIGAEWYPIRWLGVAGHTGFRWTRQDTTSPPDNNNTSTDRTEQFFTTFRSGLVVNFYFR